MVGHISIGDSFMSLHFSFVYGHRSVSCVRQEWRAIMLAEGLMVSTSCIAVFFEMPDGIQIKYSANEQQLIECMGRTSLSNTATL